MTPEDILWDMDNGPWEWKGEVLRNFKTAYGKFFSKRAGYVSLEMLPHFINYRRSKQIFDPSSEEALIYKTLVENDSLLSKELKILTGYVGGRKKRKSANPFENIPEIGIAAKDAKTESRFESAITRLQMSGFVTIADFEYLYDRHGNPYGWGLARYTTPEALYGITPAECKPSESYFIMLTRLREHLPYTNPVQLSKLLG